MYRGRFPKAGRYVKFDHRTHSPAQLREFLQHGRIEEYALIPWGSNYTFLVALDIGHEAPLLGVYKPRRGEAPLWDFPEGTLYKREYAAFLFSEALGWHLVPPTVIRDGPKGIGSVQLYIHHREEDADYFALRAQYVHEVKTIAVFDLLANNADRKAGHCLRGEDGRIWGIDHGLTFHPHPKLRTVIWDFGGERIPAALLRDIARLCGELEAQQGLASLLEHLLEPVEIAALITRMQRLLTHPAFPCLHSRRGVPWPFY